MKVMRTYTIEEEIAERLKKEGNASKLINQLLEEYFHKSDINSMTIEELEREQKKLEILMEAEKKVKELMNGKL